MMVSETATSRHRQVLQLQPCRTATGLCSDAVNISAFLTAAEAPEAVQMADACHNAQGLMQSFSNLRLLAVVVMIVVVVVDLVTSCCFLL